MSRNIEYTSSIPNPLNLSNLMDELKAGLTLTQQEEDDLGLSYNEGGGSLLSRGSLINSDVVEPEKLIIFNVPNTINQSEVDAILQNHSG